MPARRKMTFLQAALILSFLFHGVGLFGWAVVPQPRHDDDTRPTTTVTLRDYVVADHIRRVAPAAVADTAVPESNGPRVVYAHQPTYIGHIARTRPQQENHSPDPIDVRSPIDLPAASRDDREAEAEPSDEPSGSATPPEPKTTPTPASTPAPAATPSPRPTQLAVATPTPAAPPSPPPNSGPVQDPKADFALEIDYHNDDRVVQKSPDGSQHLAPLNTVCALADVKPVLAKVPRQTLPLTQADAYGLHPLDDVKATVSLSVDGKKDALVPAATLSDVEVDEVTVSGKPLTGPALTKIVDFIKHGVLSTQWLPAMNYGQQTEHCKTTLEVEIIQVSGDTAMASPMSRAP